MLLCISTKQSTVLTTPNLRQPNRGTHWCLSWRWEWSKIRHPDTGIIHSAGASRNLGVERRNHVHSAFLWEISDLYLRDEIPSNTLIKRNFLWFWRLSEDGSCNYWSLASPWLIWRNDIDPTVLMVNVLEPGYDISWRMSVHEPTASHPPHNLPCYVTSYNWLVHTRGKYAPELAVF